MNKHKHLLRELSKFTAGIVTADIICGIWLYTNHLLPINFFGIYVTDAMVTPWIIFDLILLGILIHYGWKAEIQAPSLSQRKFFLIVGTILGIVSILHLLRLLFGFEVVLGGWVAPYWLSWVGTIIAGYLSYESFHFAQHKK